MHANFFSKVSGPAYKWFLFLLSHFYDSSNQVQMESLKLTHLTGWRVREKPCEIGR